MDQPALPTAAELGISEGEYARILRDMQRPRDSGPSGAQSSRDRRAGWLPLAVLAVVAAVGAVLLAPPEPEPTYAFLYTVEGQPVTYSSCGTIEVAVYPAGGPPDAEALVDEAVAKMRDATGLDIVVAGSFVGQAPRWNFEGPVQQDDPISVSWQDAQAIEGLTDHTAGLGGSLVIPGPDGTQRLVAGTIALSRDYYASLSERGDQDEALAVLLHEFGHVFGLDHVDSPSELMNGGTTRRRTSLGAGDLQGLRLLGRGPCL